MHLSPSKARLTTFFKYMPIFHLSQNATRSRPAAKSRDQAGGYLLARPADEVSVADVIRAVEGPLANVRGVAPETLAYPGPAARLQDVWIALRANVRAVLEQVTLADLARGELPPHVAELTRNADAWVRR